MTPKRSAIVIVIAALTAVAPASADQTKTITATGTAQEKVTPSNPKSNASIRAAVDKARKAGITSAIHDAHEYALDYAKATGLTLGAVTSVSDAQSGGFYGPGFFGPFGPNQYCGKTTRPIIKVIGGKRRRVGQRHVFRCFVPPFEITTVTVTYAAS